MNPKRLVSTLPLLVLIGLLCTIGSVGADEKEKATAALNQVQAQIEKLQQKLEADRGKQGSLQAGLRRIERQLGKTARELKRIERELGKREQRLDALRAKQSKQLNALAQHQDALARQVRAAYATGRQERIKLLLNQDDPASLGRTLVYYDYFNRARTERIAAVELALTDLRKTEAQIDLETQALKTDREKARDRQRTLEQGRQERKGVLSSLNREIKRNNRSLEELREDQKQLQQLITSLSRTLEDLAAPPGAAIAFSKLKGTLPWPTQGTIKARFGQQRENSGGKINWRGVLIAAPEGRKVHAISHGRVAFADWMRGFGLLVIIDHGNGYMSLYGHNQSLYQATGDWVEAGAVIAGAGNSGGQAQTGLYFEIRKNGKPVDPAQWCNAQAKLAGKQAGDRD